MTNLENGRSLQLRVNDRGPFVDGRLIDVSRRAAQLLGFETKGTTPVRVKILKDDSIEAAEEAMHNSGRRRVMVAAGAAAALRCRRLRRPHAPGCRAAGERRRPRRSPANVVAAPPHRRHRGRAPLRAAGAVSAATA